jgi:hypothetical protein
MKKTAAILLFLFTLVQAGPAVAALFSSSPVVFVVDEEKGTEKTEEDKKSKKDPVSIPYQSVQVSLEAVIALHEAEKILVSPCLEKISPPPNFC